MNNLKRVLCLSLAVVMIVGMMVVGTSAANFTDSSAIVNTEAVNTMSALNIINGKGDGSYFDPTGIVTRGEMAKMICVALNGGRDPQLGSTAYSFTDTVGHWAAGYIEYCYNLGIVSGRGNGIFDPNGTVTGTEAAKMLLVAIGYDATAEKFTGASWSIAVNVRANQKNFYEKLGSMNPALGLTRDNAAQMVYNAINATKVEYDYKLTTVGGVLTTVAVVKDVTVAPLTIIADKFSMVTVKGVLDGVSYNKDTGKYTYSYTTAAVPGGAAGVALAATTTDYTAFYGMYVKILYKAGATENTIYGMYDASSLTVKTTVGALSDGTSGGVNKVKVGTTSYNIAAAYGALPGYVFNTGVSTLIVGGANKTIGGLSTVSGTATGGSYDNASDVILVSSDANTTIDYAVVIPKTVAKVTNVSTLGVNAGGAYTYADDTIEAGLAVNDWVTVVAAANAFTGKDILAKAPVVSGEITGLDGTRILINGTWYKLSANPGDAAALGSTFNAVVVGGYYYNLTKVSGTSVSNVVYVSAAAPGDGTFKLPQAKIYKSDGTNAIVSISYVGATKQTVASGAPATGLYTYVVDSDGNYKITAAATGNPTGLTYSAAGGNFIAATTTTDPMIGTSMIADDAVIFVKDSTGIKVYTGAQVKAWSANLTNTTSNLLTKTVNGLPTVKAALMESAGTASTGATGNYGYVVSTPYSILDGTNTYLTYQMWNGTSTVTVIDKGTTVTPVKGSIVTYTDLGNGYISVTSNAAAQASVTGFSDKALAVNYDGLVASGTQATLTLASTTKYLYINTTDYTGVSTGTIALAGKNVAGTGYDKNVYVIDDGAGKAKLVVVEVNNAMDAAAVASVYTLPAIAVTNGNGLTLAASYAVPTAKIGDTVTVSVVVTGNAAAAGTITIGGIVPAAGTALSGTVANMTVTNDTTIAVTGAAATTGTITFTYVVTAGNVATAPTVVSA